MPVAGGDVVVPGFVVSVVSFRTGDPELGSGVAVLVGNIVVVGVVAFVVVVVVVVVGIGPGRDIEI